MAISFTYFNNQNPIDHGAPAKQLLLQILTFYLL